MYIAYKLTKTTTMKVENDFHLIIEPIFLHVKISYFLHVFEYELFQRPKTRFHPKVYEIKVDIYNII